MSTTSSSPVPRSGPADGRRASSAVSALRRLLTTTLRLIDAWWRADRIRAAPSEGKLLRLRPPAMLLVTGEPVQVVSRCVGQGAEGPYIVYDCRTERGAAQIKVSTIGAAGTAQIQWIEAGRQIILPPEQVEIWTAH